MRSHVQHNHRAGFSLLELMIVMVVIGILTTIAVPSFRTLQLHARRAELPGALDGIKVAQISYEATFDTYLALEVQPRADGALDKRGVPWNVAAAEWQAVGWEPDGLVRGNYQVALSPPEHPDVAFLITGHSDVDDDDALCEFTASESFNVSVEDELLLVY